MILSEEKKYKKRPASKREEKSAEFEQRLIDLRRVARVVAGGRRFTFRATLVVGDRGGWVGIGTGKGADTTIAIDKAVRIAKKNLIKVPITKNNSLPYESKGKYGAAKVLLRSAPAGKGLTAGSSARVILELAGVKNATAKILSRTKNKLNNAKATLEAIKKLSL
ncbi:MAG: 30S ribosomal protein S5 [Candidatus Niyogibacteria bacterium]|nr:30S ribosomal protein S5 [Candidatus Niyogibacteria bacterium]